MSRPSDDISENYSETLLDFEESSVDSDDSSIDSDDAPELSELSKIFAAKGYINGSHYKRNGIEYRLIELGRNSAISIDQDGTAEYYAETSSGFYKTDETFTDYSKDPIEEREKELLYNKIIRIIDQKAVSFGLSQEVARQAQDLHVTCVEIMMRAPEVVALNYGLDQINNACMNVRNRHSLEDNVNIMSSGIQRELMRDGRQVSDDQLKFIRKWMFREIAVTQFPQAEDITEKFNSVRNLTENYQFDAIFIGLTQEQAEIISENQSEYLVEIYDDSDTDPHQMQGEYNKISGFNEYYQFDALDIGLTREQVENITQYQSEYLVGIQEKNDFSSEQIQSKYSEIIALEGHNKNAFDRGLNHDVAAGLTLNQYQQIDAIMNDSVRIPEIGKSAEEMDRKYFLMSYNKACRNGLMVEEDVVISDGVPSSDPSVAVARVTTREREDSDLENDHPSKRSR